MTFSLLLGAAGILAGVIAAITGFGIGSLLTPILAHETGTKIAVAATAIPHFAGTLQRFGFLRRHVDRRVLLRFGIASAIGGLVGALAHSRISSPILAMVFGGLLILAGLSEFTRWIERLRWGRRAAWIAGALSGALGGLVGNQGGIRSAALLGFEVPKESFVATATAIGLFVDAARLPVYLATDWRAIAEIWPRVLIATLGVMVGTVLGMRGLGHLPERVFRRVVAALLLVLGVYMVVSRGG